MSENNNEKGEGILLQTPPQEYAQKVLDQQESAEACARTLVSTALLQQLTQEQASVYAQSLANNLGPQAESFWIKYNELWDKAQE